MVFYSSIVFILPFYWVSSSSNWGGSGFCRGSSASVFMIPTIFVIGVIIRNCVSFANMIAPAPRMTHVKIVVKNCRNA